MGFLKSIFGDYSSRELKSIYPIVDKIEALGDEYKALTDAELQAKTPEFKERLANGETLDDILPEAFATVREAADRVLGMRPYRVQLVGGIVLHQGRIAEMKTGEGKTLVATLPAYLNALTGEGVHVITVNDYLARRDSEWMGKVYRFLGLTVGLVVHGVESDDRKKAYEADVTYGTNNEFGFDYLRDNMVTYKANMVQRGHAYAIVDEVDSILIDEARTPLIISGRGEDSSSLYTQVDRFVRTLRKSVVVELEDKVSTDEQADGDYVVDEKHKTCTLTAAGIKKAETYFKVENLAAAENMTLAHHIDQAIKAYGVMQRDIDYVVKDGQVIIVDEFTGRLMIGRRYNEGLHQAIEAKEGVKIAAESKTLATITFQNYFRMYKKLSGMTGTARTEATEFTEIYGLNIVSVPTNRPVQRKDYPDAIYKTVEGKYRAVIEQVMECHKNGQPVLVGTVSVEKSEILAKMLQRHTRDFNVLNAKNHEREAEIVAQAGKKGAITIATNMAGRGTDIMLGGNAEFMAKAQMRKEHFCENLLSPEKPEDADPAAVEMLLTEANGHGDTEDTNILAARKRFDELYAQCKPQIDAEAEQVRAAGGLFIVGTERHESRRIDNQLRGRSGRQGDPGSTCFYLSMEDNLLKIFGGDRMKAMATHLKLEEGIPIESKMLSRMIENAQRKVEARNYDIRKQLLEFDDVQNDQRHEIYKVRNEILDSQDLSESVREMRHGFYSDLVRQYVPAETVEDQWDLDGLTSTLRSEWAVNLDTKAWMEEDESRTDEDLEQKVLDEADRVYNEKVELVGADAWNGFCRSVLLQVLDQTWRQHISALDLLRQGIFLRGYAQKQPKQEYKKEAFSMFEELLDLTREGVVRILMQVQIQMPEEAEEAEHEATEEAQRQMDAAQASQAEFTSLTAPENEPEAQEATVDDIAFAGVGRNDPCPCGSGKKFKDCHGKLN